MAKQPYSAGYAKNSVPYARYGGGDKVLLVIDGLDFTHRPPGRMDNLMYGYIKALNADGYTVYITRRKAGLPAGYTMNDMAKDYAVMIQNEITAPADVMGISTGGPIAQCLAAEYPGLVRRLVLACTGCRLSKSGQAIQRRVLELAKAGKARAAAASLADGLGTGISGAFYKAMMWLMAGAIIPGGRTADGIVEMEAEDTFDFRGRLGEIMSPTLVIGGDKDLFYDLKELAAGITGSRLILYNGSHSAIMKKEFTRDVKAFLE